MDSAELTEVLARLGSRSVQQSGSHIRLQCDDPVHVITIPNNRPLRVGTLATIITMWPRSIRMKRDVLVKLLLL